MRHALEVAPCGECRALVSRVTGCAHWKPAAAVARAVKARQTREGISRRKRTAASRTAAAGFHQQMGIGAERR